MQIACNLLWFKRLYFIIASFFVPFPLFAIALVLETGQPQGIAPTPLLFHNRYPFAVYLYEIYAIGQVRNVDGCAVALL